MLRKFCYAAAAIMINMNITAADTEKKTEMNKEETPMYCSYILGDTKGNVYYFENEKQKVPMASITKIMTLMLTYDAINEGKIKLTDKVVVDKTMAEMQGSRIWMKEGSKISVEDLIKATAVHSANNAAYGLAKTVGGDIDNFVRMMNKKAKDLGFDDGINYSTPTGLPPHMTGRGEDIGSAEGIYKLSLEALKYPEYIEIASKKETVLPYLGGRKIYNRNKLLGKEGIYGIKTGHHDNWYNITVASKKNDVETITVVLGAPTEEARNEKIIEEIKLFHSEYKLVEFLNTDIPVTDIRVEEGTVRNLEVYPAKEFKSIVKNDSAVEFIISKKTSLKAPVKSGEYVGEYILRINGKTADTGKLIVRESVKEKRWNFFE